MHSTYGEIKNKIVELEKTISSKEDELAKAMGIIADPKATRESRKQAGAHVGRLVDEIEDAKAELQILEVRNVNWKETATKLIETLSALSTPPFDMVTISASNRGVRKTDENEEEKRRAELIRKEQEDVAQLNHRRARVAGSIEDLRETLAKKSSYIDLRAYGEEIDARIKNLKEDLSDVPEAYRKEGNDLLNQIAQSKHQAIQREKNAAAVAERQREKAVDKMKNYDYA